MRWRWRLFPARSWVCWPACCPRSRRRSSARSRRCDTIEGSGLKQSLFGHRRIAPLIRDAPQIDGCDGSPMFQIASAAIGESVVGTATPARPFHVFVVIEFAEIVSFQACGVGFQKIHVEVDGSVARQRLAHLFAEQNGFA